MALDSPERVKYFGLKNFRACGICRRRTGRSATRSATRHNPVQIQTLYDEATADVHTRPLQRRRKRFRNRLSRHGFEYTKRCRLTSHANHSLVHIPQYQPTAFGGLIRYECMHIYYINYCSWALEHLVQCVPQNMYTVIDKIVKSCHQFRDPIMGATHPRLPSILKLKHFTAERRVRAIFYWAHVLGLQADVITEPCRRHAQGVVATLQLLLIATRGHRSYTSGELDIVFRDVGRQFFTHLEALAKHVHDVHLESLQERHEANPEEIAAPVPFEPKGRYFHVVVAILYVVVEYLIFK